MIIAHLKAVIVIVIIIIIIIISCVYFPPYLGAIHVPEDMSSVLLMDSALHRI